MTRITNADQVLMLLRAHLQRAEQTRRSRKTDTATKGAGSSPLARLQGIANQEELPEAVVARALIAGLLAEEFGPEVANDAGFQSMVDQVSQMISRDKDGAAMIKNALVQLRRDA